MMDTWALPLLFQTRDEAINPGLWPGSWVPGPVAFRSRTCPPSMRVPDGQIQSGISGEALR